MMHKKYAFYKDPNMNPKIVRVLNFLFLHRYLFSCKQCLKKGSVFKVVHYIECKVRIYCYQASG